ncbi:unnamed protein product [Strongylus vulgaris]|uniref:Uncharacterized protein n=1 Tax=Strongylus vulgaris TaxID=40348 RepID=A0A3P7I6S8_STRVU|nr:unnamed protein product [Strongylus vulgaris]
MAIIEGIPSFKFSNPLGSPELVLIVSWLGRRVGCDQQAVSSRLGQLRQHRRGPFRFGNLIALKLVCTVAAVSGALSRHGGRISVQMSDLLVSSINENSVIYDGVAQDCSSSASFFFNVEEVATSIVFNIVGEDVQAADMVLLNDPNRLEHDNLSNQ